MMTTAVSDIETRRRWVLHDMKWFVLLRRARVLRWIPFVRFALAAGSMATGVVSKDSDFDLILGVRFGRMFTARFLLITVLGALGWRRRNLSHGTSARDTLCLNHFVTERSYRLREPHNPYWQNLYRSLVPVYGERSVLEAFFAANEDWVGTGIGYREDLRHRMEHPAGLTRIIERMLSGRFGDAAESWLRGPQLVRLRAKLLHLAGYKPRLVLSDEELELHLDTKRIEEYRI
jgi:hypothetical protein